MRAWLRAGLGVALGLEYSLLDNAWHSTRPEEWDYRYRRISNATCVPTALADLTEHPSIQRHECARKCAAGTVCADRTGPECHCDGHTPLTDVEGNGALCLP